MQKTILTPFQKFVKIESLGGILLLAATIIALAWANSPYVGTYQGIWAYELGIQTDSFVFTKPLILWINDGLMAIFFFLIGLEIKREMLIGELNSIKKMAFPLLGAVGGMIIPVVLFIILNENQATLDGWGIPMATDIAFSLAILNSLGKRVPLSLKVFLTAFAIIDDIGAVLVIAIFYSGTLNVTLLMIALGMLAILYYLGRKGFYSKFLLLFAGVIIWFLFLKVGVHPTIAGILLVFSIPIRQKIKTETFLTELEQVYNKIKGATILNKPILSNEQLGHVGTLEDWSSKFQSPLQHLEHNLHGWVAYFIIPIFALANAGVMINGGTDINTALMINIIICLFLGKGLGIPLVILLGKKLKIIDIPDDINGWQIVGVSFLAGIGFTMAIFIASLAFLSTPEYINTAKIGILIGSFISGTVGFIILQWSRQSKQEIGITNNRNESL